MDSIVERGMRTEPMYMNGESGSSSLIWDVFQGKITLTVAPRRSNSGDGGGGGSLRDAPKRRLHRDVVTILERGLEKMKEAKPDTSYPIVVFAWDNQERKQKRDYVITLGRDENRVHYMDVDMGNGKERFRFGKVRNINLGSDPLQDAEQSSIKMSSFLTWLQRTVPTEQVLTSTPIQQRGGGGGQQRSSSGGGQSSGGQGSGTKAADGFDDDFV